MSRRTYPRIGYSRHYGPKSMKKCCVCGLRATRRVDVEVTWMRGDDVVLNACDAHHIDTAALLATPAAIKQLES